MHAPILGALPAVLSTAGSGLLLWTGLSLAMAPAAGSGELQGLQAWSLATGLGLLAASLALAVLRLPRGRRGLAPGPLRVLLTGGLAALLAAGLLATMPGPAPAASHGHGWRFAAGLLAPVALVAIVAGALAAPAQAGGGAGLAVTRRLLAAMLAGLALLLALMATHLPVGADGVRMPGLLLVPGSLLVATQALGWREAGRSGRAIPGLPSRLLVSGLAVGPPLLVLALEAMRPGSIGAAALWLVAVAILLGLLPGSAGPRPDATTSAVPAPGTGPEHSA